MQITGYDYVIISNVSPNIAVTEFNHRIKSMWNNVQTHYMEELNDENCFITYIKNNEMEVFFDEHAYSITREGDGPFSLISNSYENISMDVNTRKISLDTDDLEFDNDEYNSYKILLKNSFQYTLVLPESLENDFCRSIFEVLESILTK
ncbi:hypothetical protein [Acinetobacter bereziniae]|uniref:hypothetical protein n=1 Tax=Acinetobacter bereziniae TaxID=106648 RepID=UPI0005AB15AF|nr:hypothetical protein [Acinetobacter bereziniae]MBI0394489.1 hypothetical protein [Acinetobacter bereziniae]